MIIGGHSQSVGSSFLVAHWTRASSRQTLVISLHLVSPRNTTAPETSLKLPEHQRTSRIYEEYLQRLPGYFVISQVLLHQNHDDFFKNKIQRNLDIEYQKIHSVVINTQIGYVGPSLVMLLLKKCKITSGQAKASALITANCLL